MRGLLLISGGIDSPVAGHIMKKWMPLSSIHFDSQPFTDGKSMNKALDLCKIIGIKKMYVIKHGQVQAEIIRALGKERKNTCILCRRLMFYISSEIAIRDGFDFLITGENIGQVASQTLSNISVVSPASKVPILRPLLCYDKIETIKIAHKIGTYTTSILPGMCCNIVPKDPATKSDLKGIEEIEKEINLQKIILEAISGAKIISL